MNNLDGVEVMLVRCMTVVHHYKEMIGKSLEGEARLRALEEKNKKLLKNKVELNFASKTQMLEVVQSALKSNLWKRRSSLYRLL